ncbi:MAG: hypothetical protein COZ85_00220, partial [Candidatus Moranbacteria bacterium CG_4_8_14_3_um_filter_34_16]
MGAQKIIENKPREKSKRKMKINFKNKIAIFFTILIVATEGFGLLFDFSQAQVAPSNFSLRQIDMAAYIVNSENKEIPNGEYEARFALYQTDRNETDPFPSDTDAKIWSETKKIQIENGMLKTQLGSVNPIPENLNFSQGVYYLGIRIGQDSEMIPRKRIAATPLAINAFNAQNAKNAETLQGFAVGFKEGDILKLGKGGKIDIKNLPTGNSGNNLVLASDLPESKIT